MNPVNGRRITHFLGAVVVTIWAGLLSMPMPSASAQPCPDVEVMFARGTGEAPGVGGIGQPFVDSLRWHVLPRSVGVYAVNYPASSDFGNRIAFTGNVVDGVRDARTRLEFMAAHCPNTRMVLGGYSQGAAVAGFVTSGEVPEGVPAEAVPAPMPPELADHVAAVVLFGKPSGQFMQKYGAPLIAIGPLYAGKTIDLCALDDAICSNAPGWLPNIAHSLYPVNGMTNEAAAFAASRL